MLRYSIAALTCLGLALPASSALAAKGWHAVQSQSSGNRNRTAHMYYANHSLVMQSDGDPNSMIIDLPTGLMTMIDSQRKIYTQATLKELMVAREKMKAKMMSQVASMPAEMQENMKMMIKEQEAADKRPLKIKSTGKKDKVSGHACTYYSWIGPQGTGEACIAKKLPVSTRGFQSDAKKLVRAMKKSGAGSAAATNLVELQLAEYGFPLKTVRTIKMGAQEMKTTVIVDKIEAMDVPADKLAAPKTFKKITFEAFMQLQTSPGR